jgi:hypothetical protein
MRLLNWFRTKSALVEDIAKLEKLVDIQARRIAELTVLCKYHRKVQRTLEIQLNVLEATQNLNSRED